MEKDKQVKKHKTLYNAEKTLGEGVTVPKKKSKEENKIDKTIKAKKKAPLTKTGSLLDSSPSAAGTSRIEGSKTESVIENKTDKIETAKEKTTKAKIAGTSTKPKTTRLITKSKVTGPSMKSKVTGPSVKSKVTGPSVKSKVTEPSVKSKVTEPSTKTKLAKDLTTKAGTSGIKVPKKQSAAENNIHKPEKTTKNVKLMEEVYEAIVNVGEPRKGATSQAIKKYIFGKRGEGIEGEFSNKRLNNIINNVLRKAVEDGNLARPGSKETTVSAVGRFILPKTAVKSKLSGAKKAESNETSK